MRKYHQYSISLNEQNSYLKEYISCNQSYEQNRYLTKRLQFLTVPTKKTEINKKTPEMLYN